MHSMGWLLGGLSRVPPPLALEFPSQFPSSSTLTALGACNCCSVVLVFVVGLWSFCWHLAVCDSEANVC